jgi:hypothetical protein
MAWLPGEPAWQQWQTDSVVVAPLFFGGAVMGASSWAVDGYANPGPWARTPFGRDGASRPGPHPGSLSLGSGRATHRRARGQICPFPCFFFRPRKREKWHTFVTQKVHSLTIVPFIATELGEKNSLYLSYKFIFTHNFYNEIHFYMTVFISRSHS